MNKTNVLDELFEADDVLREEALEREALEVLGWCEDER